MAAGGGILEDVFAEFAKIENDKSEDKKINLTTVKKWLKQANVIDGERITETDNEICFNKLKNNQLDYKQFIEYIEDLANYKNVDLVEINSKLLSCGSSIFENTAQSIIGRLTDSHSIHENQKQQKQEDKIINDAKKSQSKNHSTILSIFDKSRKNKD